MGNSHWDYLRQAALLERQNKLRDQLVLVRESFEKFNITHEKAFQIANLNVQEAVQKLNSSQLTSEELLASLIFRVNAFGKEFNFYMATNFSFAIQAAKSCDKKRKQTGKKNWTFEDGVYDSEKFLPPLFGIPISVKDVLDVDSMPTTIGLCSRTKNYPAQSPLIKCLKNSGMIPFIKTTTPQFSMNFQTHSYLWGRTLNPWNKQRAVGGSSGGQGAIISSKCSLIGVGSDLGGSIRIPAEFCGLFGLKTSSKRISTAYHTEYSKQFHSFTENISLSLGPIAKSARDLAMYLNVVTHEQFYQGEDDPYTKIIPFNTKQFLQTEKGDKKWRVGYIKSFKDLEPSHASRRAVQQTIDLLQKEGHQVFQIQIPHEREVIREFVGEHGSTGGQNYRNLLNGQKNVEEYKTLFQIGQMWNPTRFLFSVMAKKFLPRLQFYFLQRQKYEKVIDYQRHVGQISQLKSSWIKYWREKKLDFVICPGFGCQAFQHGKSDKLAMTCFYTVVWNVLDVTAGAVPVTVVQENEQHYQSAFNDLVTKQLKEIAKDSQGLPVGIQVVGLPYAQQKVLGFMSYLEKKIKFYDKYPLPNI